MEESIVIESKKNELNCRLFYTTGILMIYILGRELPLYGINIDVHQGERLGAAELLMQAIGGDASQTSLFALGISPYILSVLLVQIFNMIKGSITKSKSSPKRTGRMSMIITLLYSLVQAIVHIDQLSFMEAGNEILAIKGLVILEMITGVMLIVWLVERNKKYGIGGRAIIIYVNIMSGIISTMGFHRIRELIMPVLVGILLMTVMLVMENAEMRIPVQRISIYSIYADKNYQAIKLSPMGVMPIMFSTAVFRLPQSILALLHRTIPDHEAIAWWNTNMVMNRSLGITVYLIIIYVLTIGLSMVFLNPGDLAEQFLKNGDSIVNIYAGKNTKRYLVKVVLTISFFSGTVMGICVGTPLLLQQSGNLDSALVMLPTSLMMLSGIWYNLYREFKTIQGSDSYRSFI